MLKRLPLVLLLAAGLGCGGGGIQHTACANDGDLCQDGEVCKSHTCVPCTSQDACGTLACISQRCRACTNNAQCGPGRLCQGGSCVGCQKSSDCPLAQACVGGACVPCASASDCGDGRACVHEKCVACTGDTDCDSGLICTNGQCVPCTDTHQCSGGLACVAGACAHCTDSTQCLTGDVCLGGLCGACQSRDQCPTGEICSNGHCTNCATAADCNQGEACVAGLCGKCQAASDCRTGQVCRDGVCGPCGSTTECGGGLVCRDSSCQACVSAAECPTQGQVCIQGVCRACQSETECATIISGDACVNGLCQSCTSADQCDAGEGCVAGVCGPCTTAQDCRAGEICLVANHRCGTPGAADHLVLVGGQSQTATVATRLPVELQVEVVDATGEPVPDVTLTFTATTGGGSPGDATVTSDRNGGAATTWLLGPTAGPQTLVVARQDTPLPDEAQSGNRTLTFSATANADVADHLVIVAGDPQTVDAGLPAPTDPEVQVVDQYGNGIPNVTLDWTVTAGAGALAHPTVTTDAHGDASDAFTLDQKPGTNTIEVAGNPPLPDVKVTGHATATFTLTGVTGPADHLDKIAGGDAQTGKVGTKLATDPQVRVVDRFENPVSGVKLAFVATDMTPASDVETSDSNGLASVAYTLGTTAGAATLTVSGSDAALPDLAGTGRPSVTFTETVRAGDPDHLDLVAGDGQTAIVGTKLPIDPAVKVVDQYENPLSGVSIAFDVTEGGGTASHPKTTSGAGGLASTSYTMGFATGAQTIVASRETSALPGKKGLATIKFTETAPAPTTTSLDPTWLPIAGGTLTITGTNFGSDSTVTVGGVSAPVTSQTATQLVATAPDISTHPEVPAGNNDVVVTSGGTATAALQVFYALKFTPTDCFDNASTGYGKIGSDWPPQSRVASDVDGSGQRVTSDWNANELRNLYLGYDDSNVYIAIDGQAEEQNAIVGYIYEDGMAQSDWNASADIKTSLADNCDTSYAGDGNGFGNNTCFSLNAMLSSGFDASQLSDWYAYYGFGRTGNAVDLSNDWANASGVRQLHPVSNFYWMKSTVAHSGQAQELSIPWTTFAIDPGGKITKLEIWVRLDSCGTPVGGNPPPPCYANYFSNQSLPYDPNASSSDTNLRYKVTTVSTLDVK